MTPDMRGRQALGIQLVALGLGDKSRSPTSLRLWHRFLHWSYLAGITEAMQSHSAGIRNMNVDAHKAIEISYRLSPNNIGS
jgi:hypothetical protein